MVTSTNCPVCGKSLIFSCEPSKKEEIQVECSGCGRQYSFEGNKLVTNSLFETIADTRSDGINPKTGLEYWKVVRIRYFYKGKQVPKNIFVKLFNTFVKKQGIGPDCPT